MSLWVPKTKSNKESGDNSVIYKRDVWVALKTTACKWELGILVVSTVLSPAPFEILGEHDFLCDLILLWCGGGAGGAALKYWDRRCYEGAECNSFPTLSDFSFQEDY